MADLVLINKADGDRIKLAKKTRIDYKNALHLFPPKTSNWTAKALTCSAITNQGIEKVWEQIGKYIKLTQKNRYFEKNRQQQAKYWLEAAINQGLQTTFYQNDAVKSALINIEKAVLKNELSPFQGAMQLLKLFKQS